MTKSGVERVSQGRDGGNRWPDGLKSKGLCAKDGDKRQSTDIRQMSVHSPGDRIGLTEKANLLRAEMGLPPFIC